MKNFFSGIILFFIFIILNILNSKEDIGLNGFYTWCWDDSLNDKVKCNLIDGCDISGFGCGKNIDLKNEVSISFHSYVDDSSKSKTFEIVNNSNIGASFDQKNYISFRHKLQRKLKNLFFINCEVLLSRFIDLNKILREDAMEFIMDTPILANNRDCSIIFFDLLIEFTKIGDLKKYSHFLYQYEKLLGYRKENTDLSTSENESEKKIVNKLYQELNEFLFKKREYNVLDENKDILSQLFIYKTIGLDYKNLIDISSLPGNYSILEKYKDNFDLTLIREQSECGSCWAFSVAEVFSDRRTIHALSHGDHSWDKSVASAWDVASCSVPNKNGCDGGYVKNAFHHSKKYGIVSGGPYEFKYSGRSCQPYQIPPCTDPSLLTPEQYEKCLKGTFITKCTHKCLDPYYKKSYIQDKSFPKTYPIVFSGEYRHIIKDLYLYGSISAYLTIFTDFLAWDWETWPVYIHSYGEYLGGHELKVVGYGYDRKMKIPYYLAVNSWSSRWGIKGTLRIPILYVLKGNLNYYIIYLANFIAIYF